VVINKEIRQVSIRLWEKEPALGIQAIKGKHRFKVRFEILTAMAMKITVFWDMMYMLW
jgi:hypothetical protein